MSTCDIDLGQMTHPGPSQEGHINRCGRCAQRLAGTDIRCRLFPANVLLPGGQSQNIAALSFAIDSLADKPARQVAHEFALAGEETKPWSPQGHGHSQALSFAHSDIDAERSGRF